MIGAEIPHIRVTLTRLNSLYLIFRHLYLHSNNNSRKRDYGSEMKQEEHSEGTGERKGEGEKMELYLNFKAFPQIHSLFFPFTTPSWNDWWLQRRLILYFETPPTLFLLNLYNTVNFPQFQPRDPPEIRPPPSNLTPVLSLSSLVLGAPQTLCRR